MKDSPLLPFWMPIAVFGVVLAIIFGLGYVLLQVAYATEHMIPGLHSGGVIIVALLISAAIVGAAALYASRPDPSAPPDRPSRPSH